MIYCIYQRVDKKKIAFASYMSFFVIIINRNDIIYVNMQALCKKKKTLLIFIIFEIRYKEKGYEKITVYDKDYLNYLL